MFVVSSAVTMRTRSKVGKRIEQTPVNQFVINSYVLHVLIEGQQYFLELGIKTKNNLMKIHQVVYTGGPDGIRVRDA